MPTATLGDSRDDGPNRIQTDPINAARVIPLIRPLIASIRRRGGIPVVASIERPPRPDRNVPPSSSVLPGRSPPQIG
jgi:hypothetical protein